MGRDRRAPVAGCRTHGTGDGCLVELSTDRWRFILRQAVENRSFLSFLLASALGHGAVLPVPVPGGQQPSPLHPCSTPRDLSRVPVDLHGDALHDPYILFLLPVFVRVHHAISFSLWSARCISQRSGNQRKLRNGSLSPSGGLYTGIAVFGAIVQWKDELLYVPLRRTGPGTCGRQPGTPGDRCGPRSQR